MSNYNTIIRVWSAFEGQYRLECPVTVAVFGGMAFSRYSDSQFHDLTDGTQENRGIQMVESNILNSRSVFSASE